MTATLRVAVADDDDDTREFLERFIPRLGHTVSSVARTGRELVEHCKQAVPDLIISDVKMPGMSGLEAVATVNRVSPVPAILLTGFTEPGWIDKAREVGVMAYLLKPVTEADLAPAIVLARRHFEEIQALRRESADLRQALEDRKVIERAKGAVTRRCGLSEAEAYRRMRKFATDHGRKLIDVSHQIMTAEEAFAAIEGIPDL